MYHVCDIVNSHSLLSFPSNIYMTFLKRQSQNSSSDTRFSKRVTTEYDIQERFTTLSLQQDIKSTISTINQQPNYQSQSCFNQKSSSPLSRNILNKQSSINRTQQPTHISYGNIFIPSSITELSSESEEEMDTFADDDSTDYLQNYTTIDETCYNKEKPLFKIPSQFTIKFDK